MRLASIPSPLYVLRPELIGCQQRRIAPFPHAAFNHSGKKGTFNFLNGPMGYANAQRTLNYIRIFTEFISQPQYVNVVPMFSILNEPVVGVIGQGPLVSLCVYSLRWFWTQLTRLLVTWKSTV